MPSEECVCEYGLLPAAGGAKSSRQDVQAQRQPPAARELRQNRDPAGPRPLLHSPNRTQPQGIRPRAKNRPGNKNARRNDEAFGCVQTPVADLGGS